MKASRIIVIVISILYGLYKYYPTDIENEKPPISFNQNVDVNLPESKSDPIVEFNNESKPTIISPSNQELSSSPADIDKILDSYRELINLNDSPIIGDDGGSQEMRRIDAREKVRLSSYLLSNTPLLKKLSVQTEEIKSAITEGEKYPLYRKQYEDLSENE